MNPTRRIAVGLALGVAAASMTAAGPVAASPVAASPAAAPAAKARPVVDHGTVPRAQGAVLGPDGYKTLRLGMSAREARQTGLIQDGGVIEPCVWYRFKPSEGEQNPGNGVVVSPTRGVVSIPGTTRARTPEGITMGMLGNGKGSTRGQMKDAYPDLKRLPEGYLYRTPVPGNPDATYTFAVSMWGRVVDIMLTSNADGGCLS